MVNCWIFADDVAIGQAALTIRDRSMGVVGGDFHPMPAYAVVRAHIQATSLDDQSQMPLSARTESGELLDPIAGVHIADVPDIEVLEVTLLGLDSAAMRRFFGEARAS